MFDPSLNERGYKAERVEILENVRTLAVPDQVLVLPLGSTLSHGKVALADTDCWIWTVFHKSRADARDILTHLAKEAGANVLFDVDYVAGQGRRGNYVYTTHGYKARMGVMGVVSPKGERMDQNRVHQIASAPRAVRRLSARRKPPPVVCRPPSGQGCFYRGLCRGVFGLRGFVCFGGRGRAGSRTRQRHDVRHSSVAARDRLRPLAPGEGGEDSFPRAVFCRKAVRSRPCRASFR